MTAIVGAVPGALPTLLNATMLRVVADVVAELRVIVGVRCASREYGCQQRAVAAIQVYIESSELVRMDQSLGLRSEGLTDRSQIAVIVSPVC